MTTTKNFGDGVGEVQLVATCMGGTIHVVLHLPLHKCFPHGEFRKDLGDERETVDKAT